MSAYRILGPGAERCRLACAATALNSLSVRSCMPDTVCPGLGFGGAEADALGQHQDPETTPSARSAPETPPSEHFPGVQCP